MQFLGFNQTKGSSYNLPAHGSGGARARINKSVAKKSVCPSEDGSAGGNAEPSEQKNRGQTPPSARSKPNTTKKFLFSLREGLRKLSKVFKSSRKLSQSFLSALKKTAFAV